MPQDRVTLEPMDEFNEALIAHVHPADWTKPTPDGRSWWGSAVQADASALLLSVNENNPGARALYTAFGFEFARRRAVYEKAQASTS